MRCQLLDVTLALARAVLIGWLAISTANGQATAESDWQPGLTPWGDPDLQGVYTFSTTTPLERPEALAAKVAYTEAELAELQEQLAIQVVTDIVAPPPGGLGNAYNRFWHSNEKGRLTGRTSLIVDPPDGRKPPLTPQAGKLHEERAAEAAARRIEDPPYQYTLYYHWEEHSAYTRCVARPMPRIGQSYNHGLQILQTPGHVVIFYESMHDARIIPLDGRAPLDPRIRQWNGDSRGHWEGGTLVVESTNFTDKQEFQGALQGNMRFVERLTRVDPDTIGYEVTVHDPETWTAPWSFALPWRADDPNYENPEDLYEFACHEGNYRMMEDTLRGSRVLQEAYSERE